jgi:hypothetical protein
MGGACITHGSDKQAYSVSVRILEGGSSHMQEINMAVRISLAWISKGKGMRVRTGFSWLRIGSGAGSYEYFPLGYLTTISFNKFLIIALTIILILSLYSSDWQDGSWLIINWKGFGNKGSWLNGDTIATFCWGGLRKTIRNQTQNSGCPS